MQIIKQDKYEPGDKVMLRADEAEGWVQQEATVLGREGDEDAPISPDDMYVVEVEPEDRRDDGLRELEIDTIEGKIVD